MQRVMRLDYLSTKEKIEVYLFAQELLDDGLLPYSVKSIEHVFIFLFKGCFDEDGDLGASQSASVPKLMGCLVNDLLGNLDAYEHLALLGRGIWLHHVDDKIGSFL